MAAATPPTRHPQGTAKKCHSVSIAWTSGAATAPATEDPHPLLRIQDCRVAVPRSWGTGSRDFVPSVGLTISCRDICRQLRKGKHAVPKNTLSTHPKRTKQLSNRVKIIWCTKNRPDTVLTLDVCSIRSIWLGPHMFWMFVEGHIHDVIYHCAFCQAPRSVTTFHYHVTSLNESVC